MAQRQAPHFDATVFMDDLMTCRINGVKDDLKVEVGAEDLLGRQQEGLQFLRSMDVELRGPSQQTHGADEAGKSQTMVGMGVGNEDVPNAIHA